MFETDQLNGAMLRKSMTGMDDAQLATIGYISVLWNALERNFVACIWMIADWSQEVGELVTADLGTVDRVNLLLNLAKQSIKDDGRLLDELTVTVDLYDQMRIVRNNMMHGFFNWRHRGLDTDDNLIKFTAKRRGGYAEMVFTPVDIASLKEIVADIHRCNEGINDFLHKAYFRKRFLAGERGAFAQTYETAVHGWRAPPFDIALLRDCLKRRRTPPPRPVRARRSEHAQVGGEAQQEGSGTPGSRAGVR